MNIEQSTKDILITDFSLSEKVRLIQDFSNFRKEDIEEAVKRKYGCYVNDIYYELLKLDKERRNHGKM